MEFGGHVAPSQHNLLFDQRQKNSSQINLARALGFAGVAGHTGQQTVAGVYFLDPARPQDEPLLLSTSGPTLDELKARGEE